MVLCKLHTYSHKIKLFTFSQGHLVIHWSSKSSKCAWICVLKQRKSNIWNLQAKLTSQCHETLVIWTLIPMTFCFPKLFNDIAKVVYVQRFFTLLDVLALIVTPYCFSYMCYNWGEVLKITLIPHSFACNLICKIMHFMINVTN